MYKKPDTSLYCLPHVQPMSAQVSMYSVTFYNIVQQPPNPYNLLKPRRPFIRILTAHFWENCLLFFFLIWDTLALLDASQL